MSGCEREKQLFMVALELPTAAEREAFLRGACADDSELLGRLLVLVAAHDQSRGPLDHPPSGLEPARGVEIDATRAQLVSDRVGGEIGPYKLLQQIGEGGMGTVFMADQQQPLKRRVALKIIKPGMDTRQVIARFEAERQALSMMDHPNIAKVLDAGTTPSGRPYFVMELVKGQPITQYCDGQHLSPRERLELFLPVCQAIQHAHQKGIIHRDIKPSNVLVAEYDGRPVAKVIDFGVAKAMSQPLTDRTMFTELGAIVGTLEYMSPEQARVNQLDIDTRSDVYSLGVLLYEILTGSTPFDRQRLRSAAWDEMLRIIREEEPPRPSTRLSASATLPSIAASRRSDPSRLSKLVRGELDWIVMKALEKDRNRRYETANGFALDIQRYLAEQPVQACPPSTAYRLHKFLRRNKARVIASSLASLAVITILVMFVFFSMAARQREQLAERQVLEREQAAVRDVDVSLSSARTAVDTGNLAVAERKLGEAQSRIDVAGSQAGDLGNRIAQLEQEIRDRAGDADRFTQFIELARDGQDKMSHSHWKGGEKVATKALQLYDVLENDNWQDSLDRSYLSDEQKQIVRDTAFETLVVLADFGPRWGKTAELAELSLKYLERAQTFHEPTRAFYWVRSECHKLLHDQQAAASDTQRFEETAARTAFDYYLPGHSGGNLENAIRSYEAALVIQPDHFNSLYFLAWRLSAIGRKDESARVALACLALQPTNVMALTFRAAGLAEEGKLDEAVMLVRRALEIEPHSFNANRGLGLYLQMQQKAEEAKPFLEKAIEYSQLEIARNPGFSPHNTRLGKVYEALGRWDEAIACHRRAIEVGPNDYEGYWNLGNALVRQRNLPEAVACFRKVIELNPRNSGGYVSLAMALIAQQKLDEAHTFISKAIDLDPNNSFAHRVHCQVLVLQGKFDEALESLQKVIDLDPKDPLAQSILGQVLVQQGEFGEAIVSLQKAIDLKPDQPELRNNFAWLLATCPDLALRNPTEAVTHALKAVELSPNMAGYWNTLGVAHYRAGNFGEAIPALQKSLESRKGQADAFDLFFLAMAHWQLDQKDDARQCYERATTWMDARQPENEELRGFRREAQELLGIDSVAEPISETSVTTAETNR